MNLVDGGTSVPPSRSKRAQSRKISPGQSKGGNVVKQPVCKRCGAALSGRQRAWCSDRCRKAESRTPQKPTRTTHRVLGRREPTYRLVPEEVTGSRGQEAIDLAKQAGLVLDGFQEDVLIDGMAVSGARWAADEVAIIVARQNGKSVDLVIRGLWGPTLGGEKLVLFSAHEFKTARESFLLAKQLVETEAFQRFEPKVSISHGFEGVSFRNGNRLQFIARSRTSGRGFSPDCVILDEAFELDDLALAALKPALAAAKHPQLWYASSAPHETSEVLRRLAILGRKGDAKRLAYLEWCAPDGLAASDIAAWEAANPALGTRIDLGFVASEMDSLAPEDFERERLGRWREEDTGGVFDRQAWDKLADLNPPAPTGARALALDVSPDRQRACIAAAADLGQGRVLVEILEERKGVDWVVAEMASLVHEHKPDAVVVDSAGQAQTLIPALQAARVSVKQPAFKDMISACGAFFDAFHEGRLVHRDQPELNAAISGAKQRQVGDAWAWARRAPRANVAPLVAATLAMWGVAEAVEKQYFIFLGDPLADQPSHDPRDPWLSANWGR
jgi:phage terminase large subunit-like protein